METSSTGSSSRPALPISFLSCPPGGGCWGQGRRSRLPRAPSPQPGANDHVQPIVWILLWVVVAAGFLVGYDSSTYQVYDPAFQQLFLPEIVRTPNAGMSKGIWFVRPRGTYLAKGNIPGTYVSTETEQAYVAAAGTTPWCTYTSAKAQGMTASKYLAFAVGALLAGWTTRRFGRRATTWAACLAYTIAQVLQGTAVHFGQIMLGRILSGLANGVLMQVPYIEAAEISPTHRRGAFVCAVGVGRSLGMSCRALLMKGLAGTRLANWAWRITALFAVWPALSLLLLLPFFEDTPSGLVQRGRLEEGRRMLQALRGPYQDVTEEYNQILAAATLSMKSRTQWTLLLQRCRRPQLIVTCILHLLKCFTMSNAGSLFSMVVDEPSDIDANSTTGMVLNTVVNSIAWMLGALIAVVLADRVGRRWLMAGSAFVDGLLSLVIMVLLIVMPNELGRFSLPTAYGIAFTLGMAELATSTGEGPIGWLITVESHGLPTRALAMSLNVAVKGVADTITALSGAPMLCATRWGLFSFYTCMALLLSAFTLLFVPETKNRPLEEVALAWQDHWWWRRYNPADALKPAISLGRQQSAAEPASMLSPATSGRSAAGSFTGGGAGGVGGGREGGWGGGGGGPGAADRSRAASSALAGQRSMVARGLSTLHPAGGGGSMRQRTTADSRLGRRLGQALGLGRRQGPLNLGRVLTLDRRASTQAVGADAEMDAALREAT